MGGRVRSVDGVRRRKVAGAIQEKRRGWPMAGERVGVPRREQMAPSQEWGWGEEEGGGWVPRRRDVGGTWLGLGRGGEEGGS